MITRPMISLKYPSLLSSYLLKVINMRKVGKDILKRQKDIDKRKEG